MPVIVGIDPGIAPTLCVLIDDPGKALAVEFYEGDDVSYLTVVNTKKVRRPSAPLLRTALRDTLATLVVIEDVHAMPGQGVTSMFAFGYASGLCEGVVCALGLRLLRVTPKPGRKPTAWRPRPTSPCRATSPRILRRTWASTSARSRTTTGLKPSSLPIGHAHA